MLIRLTEQEMVDKWLLRKGFEPLRSDCQIARSDGVDLRSIARDECRIWYAKLLREAPPELLNVEDIASDPEILLSSSNAGSILVTLPKRVVRPVAVKITSWQSPATVVEADSPQAREQTNPYLRGGIIRPVAVSRPLINKLELFSPAYNDFDTLQYLLCVTRNFDADGNPLYEFDESLTP